MVILVYVEIKLTEIKDNLNRNEHKLDANDEQTVQRLTFYLNKLHKHVNYFLIKYQDSITQDEFATSDILLIRCMILSVIQLMRFFRAEPFFKTRKLDASYTVFKVCNYLKLRIFFL